MKKLLIIFIIFLFIGNSGCYLKNYISENPSNDVTVKFGIMAKDKNGNLVVEKVTTDIPLNLDPEFKFGFEVIHHSQGDFTGHVILFLPESPNSIRFTEGENYKPFKYNHSDEGKIIESGKIQYKNYWFGDFGFSKGDPVGDWKIEIYINDKLEKTINFNVYR
jgi:hypothetical protein